MSAQAEHPLGAQQLAPGAQVLMPARLSCDMPSLLRQPREGGRGGKSGGQAQPHPQSVYDPPGQPLWQPRQLALPLALS